MRILPALHCLFCLFFICPFDWNDKIRQRKFSFHSYSFFFYRSACVCGKILKNIRGMRIHRTKMGCLKRLGATLELPTDPVELSVVEQPLPVEEHTVLTAPAAEVGGRWSSIWSSGKNLFRTGKGYASKGLQTVKDGVPPPPPITRRAVSFVKGAWKCAIVHAFIVVVCLTTIPDLVSPWLCMVGLCITWLLVNPYHWEDGSYHRLDQCSYMYYCQSGPECIRIKGHNDMSPWVSCWWFCVKSCSIIMAVM